jgi:hypothetical protein
MKNILKKFFVLVVTLLGVTNIFAAPSLPAPGAKRPPPPPGLPIDDNIVILLMAGILLGMYIVYKCKKTKAPIS